MRRWARSCAATGSPRASPKRWRSPTARRCGCACWARTWWCSATPRGGWACSTSIARIAAPRCSLPQRGMRLALPLSRLEVRRGRQRGRDGLRAARQHDPERVKHRAYPAREAGGFVWCYMGPADRCREFQPPAFAPTPDARVSATKMRVRCNWAQILEGQIDSAHSSSLHSSDMVPAQVDGARRPPRTGCGLRPTRRRACRSSAPATASATPRSATRSRTRRRTTTSASRSSSRRSPR